MEFLGRVPSKPVATEGEREQTASNPISHAVREVMQRVDGIVRPELLAAEDADDLDLRIDGLLFNEDLVDAFLELSMAVSIPAMRMLIDTDSPPANIEALVGHELAARIDLVMRETVRATLQAIGAAVGPARAARSALAALASGSVSPETLARPSLYMASRFVPPELKRALVGRDAGQIAMVGVIHAREWGLPHVCVIDLCRKLVEYQTAWLDFLASLTDLDVSPGALPPIRVNWPEAFRLTQESNAALDRTADLMDIAGKQQIHYLPRHVLRIFGTMQSR